mmetsp:Transcript_29098/g.52066  ORF Transcript_29098/g.52066 Transcript_29098/m.52066 type:complete len:254 (-) Transcript_29098:509-1270(-)
MERLDPSQLASLKHLLLDLRGSSGDFQELFRDVKERGRVTPLNLISYLYDKIDLAPKDANSLKKLFYGHTEISVDVFCEKLGEVVEPRNEEVSDFTLFDELSTKTYGLSKNTRNDDWEDWPELINFSMKRHHDLSGSWDEPPKHEKSRHYDWEFSQAKQELPKEASVTKDYDFEQQWREIELQEQTVAIPRKTLLGRRQNPQAKTRVEKYSALDELRSRYIKSPLDAKPPLSVFVNARTPRFFRKLSSTSENY